MKTKWCDLFILGLMQVSNLVDIPTLLSAVNKHIGTSLNLG